MAEPATCACGEVHVRSRRLAFVRVDTPADRIAAETIASGIKDVARGMHVLLDYLVQEGDREAAGLVSVLCDRLQCEVEALDTLLELEVMVEVGEEPAPAGEPEAST